MLCLEALPASDEQGRSGARLGAPCSKDHPGAIFRTGMELAYGIAFPVTSTCDVLIAEEAAATEPCSAQGAVGAVCASRGHAASNETWRVT